MFLAKITFVLPFLSVLQESVLSLSLGLPLLDKHAHSHPASPLLAPAMQVMLCLTSLNPHHLAVTVPQIMDHKDDSQLVVEINGEFNTTGLEVGYR